MGLCCMEMGWPSLAKHKTQPRAINTETRVAAIGCQRRCHRRCKAVIPIVKTTATTTATTAARTYGAVYANIVASQTAIVGDGHCQHGGQRHSHRRITIAIASAAVSAVVAATAACLRLAETMHLTVGVGGATTTAITVNRTYRHAHTVTSQHLRNAGAACNGRRHPASNRHLPPSRHQHLSCAMAAARHNGRFRACRQPSPLPPSRGLRVPAVMA